MSQLANDSGQPRKISSIRDVVAALKEVGFPGVSEHAIASISRSSMKGEFIRLLEAVVARKAALPEENRFKAFMWLLSPPGLQSANELGYELDYDTLVNLFALKGAGICHALRTAVDAGHTQRDEAKVYVSESIKAVRAGNVVPLKPGEGEPSGAQHSEAQGSSGGPDPRHRVNHAAPSNDHAEYVAEEPINSSGEDDKRAYSSVHCYGGKAAVCFNASQNKDKTHYTIMVDGAPSVGERTYDWKNKIFTQLGHKELPVLFAVLMGWLPRAKFDAHGAANDKAVEIERQDGKFFVKVMQKGKPMCAVPVGPQDAAGLYSLVLNQIILEQPAALRSDPALVVNMLKQAFCIRPS